MTSLSIGVLGAGAIGSFVGGWLAQLGVSVTLVGRARVLTPIAQHGLDLVDLDGKTRHVTTLHTSEDPKALAACDIVLVACKSLDSARAAQDLLPVLRADAAVVSLQNGVDNPRILAETLGRERVFGGIVSWNVVWQGETQLARMTSGPIVVERRAGAAGERVVEMVKQLDKSGLDAKAHPEIERVLWSKLMFNLNNAINALLGVTIAAELADRRCRQLIAGAIGEGIAAMRKAGIEPLRLGRMSPALSVRVLPLPDTMFRLLARPMLKVGTDARSSMYSDLCVGKATEIDFLNGAVVRLGEKVGVATPINRRIVDEIRRAERAGGGSPRLTVDRLLG